MSGPEKTFENRVKKFLKNEGCWYVKYFANGFTRAGIPDILACVNGIFIGIEIKAPKGTPSELQLHTLTEIEKAGGKGILLYPKDFNSFKELIYELKES